MYEKSYVFETKTFKYRSFYDNIMIYVVREIDMNEVYAVLDIGSASIELLVGEIINSNLHVLFLKGPSHGVKGIIEDENLLVNDIKGVVQEANDFLDGEIKAVGLTIPTIRSKLYQSNSSVSLSDHDKISKDDIVRGLKLSTKFKNLMKKRWFV